MNSDFERNPRLWPISAALRISAATVDAFGALSAIGLFVLRLINQEDKADADSFIRVSAHIANHNILRVFSILR